MKEIVKKIMNEDTSAIADIKLSIMEKLNVEYKLKEIDEAKFKAKFKVKQVVKFMNNKNGKTQEGIIVKVAYDESENGNEMYFYDIESTDRLHKDTPEGDIIEKVNVKYKLKEIDEAKEKSKECSAVLQLMDKDYSYSEALKKVIKDYNVKDKAKLEKELDIYI